MGLQNFLDNREYQQTLNDPMRIRAVHEAISSGRERDEALNRLAKLATRVLDAPLGVVSLLDDGRQLFKCMYSTGNTYAFPLSIPADKSLCHFLLSGDALAIEDLKDFEADFDCSIYHQFGLTSYLGAPLRAESGAVVGTFCVLDTKARHWSAEDCETIQDIAECAMTEIQLQVSLARIEHENESRERIISMLAHDLRTPLNIIQNNAEMVLLEECDTSLMKDCTSSILRSADQATHLIDNFLDWKLSYLGPSDTINKDAFDIVGLAKNCVFDLAKIHGNIFRLTYNCKPLIGEFNEYAIRRCLENLLNNAVKYGDTSRSITLSLDKWSENCLVIGVHNYGPALSKEDLTNIFTPYYRSQSAKNKKSKGWGLGLALVQSVAYAHGGTVEALSCEKEGTIFKLILPLQASKRENLH